MPLNPVPNYPTSLDSLPDPTSATYVDDDGFELDLLLSKLNAIVEALEAKLGTGASTPDANEVLVGNGTGTSTWLAGLTTGYLANLAVTEAKIAANAVTQRSISASFTGTRTANSYADVDSTNGKIDITTTGGDVLILFFGTASNTSAGVVQTVALRKDSDSEVASLPVYSYAGLATYPVPFFTAYLWTGLSAGTYSFRARHINNSATGTMTTTARMIGVEIKK